MQRLIVGLIALIGMLLVEMLLFVIRATRKEAQSRRLMSEKAVFPGSMAVAALPSLSRRS